MDVRIKSRGYKDSGFPKIIKELSQIKSKQIIIKIDEESFDGYDLVFDDLKISNLHLIEDKEDKSYISTFSCDEKVFKNILKFVRTLKYFGDCGHSFDVKINGKTFYWDGDGSDRVIEINGIDCQRGFKSIDDNYRKFFEVNESCYHKTVKLTESKLINLLSYLIRNKNI